MRIYPYITFKASALTNVNLTLHDKNSQLKNRLYIGERVGGVWTGGRTDEWTYGRIEPIKELKVYPSSGGQLLIHSIENWLSFLSTK